MLIASVTPLALNTFTSRGCFKYSRETLVDYVTLFIVRRFHSHTDAEQHCPRPDRHPLSTAGLDHWEPGAFPHSWSERGRPDFSNWWCLLLGLVLLRLLHFFYIGNSPCSTCWTQHQAFFRSHPLNISSHLRPALKYYFRCFTGSKAPHFPRRCVFFIYFFYQQMSCCCSAVPDASALYMLYFCCGWKHFAARATDRRVLSHLRLR